MTEYGAFIKTYRKLHKQTMSQMAEKLDVSVAFLSAMEVGKKSIPKEYVEKIAQAYKLSDEEKSRLEVAVFKTNAKIELDLTKLDQNKQDVAITFARKINTADQKTLEELRKILNEEK
jgi:transcriptional regulator with XRE-family HTH domain